jgi:arsenate reductase
MAEAIVNHRLGDRWQAFSAGTHPAGYVHPMAVQALAELGIRHAGTSKNVESLRDVQFDLVVTVCDTAAEECPLWLGPGRCVHLGFSDPAKAQGSEEQRMAEFRRVRDEIDQRIPELLNRHAESIAGNAGNAGAERS